MPFSDAIDEFTRLSMIIVLNPASSSATTACEPMYPSQPVTRIAE